MSKKIRVNPQMLRKAAGEMSTMNAQYKQEYAKLYNLVEQLKSDWSGTDTAAFAEQIEGFHDNFNMMSRLMNDYVDYLNSTAVTYEKAQQEAVEAVRKLTN